jgi:hypothetical protein
MPNEREVSDKPSKENEVRATEYSIKAKVCEQLSNVNVVGITSKMGAMTYTGYTYGFSEAEANEIVSRINCDYKAHVLATIAEMEKETTIGNKAWSERTLSELERRINEC